MHPAGSSTPPKGCIQPHNCVYGPRTPIDPLCTSNETPRDWQYEPTTHQFATSPFQTRFFSRVLQGLVARRALWGMDLKGCCLWSPQFPIASPMQQPGGTSTPSDGNQKSAFPSGPRVAPPQPASTSPPPLLAYPHTSPHTPLLFFTI